MYNENQQYIHYERDLLFYAKVIFIGAKLNAVLVVIFKSRLSRRSLYNSIELVEH
jgi:hypothetical protein